MPIVNIPKKEHVESLQNDPVVLNNDVEYESSDSVVDEIILNHDNNENEILKKLMLLKFKIKMIRDLYKVGVCNRKDYYELRKNYNSLYFRQLKIYCDSHDLKKDAELCEYMIRLQETKELNKMLRYNVMKFIRSFIR